MISNKLKDLGFNLTSYGIGQHECICPFCSEKRKPANRKKKVCKVWIEDDSAGYNCVHCGEHGFVHEDKPVLKIRQYTRPNVKVKNNIGDKASLFFHNRGIRPEIAKKMQIYVDGKFGKPMLAYPYFKNGIIVNVKYRGIEEKTFCQEKNGEPIFYNYDGCFGKKEIIIVEGENDALAFMEAGFDNVVSIPAGSISNEVKEETSKFDFLKNSQALIDSCERFYLALDADSAGQAMTQALIDRLGRGKCWLVDWTVYKVEGKDANDFLKKERGILEDAIRNAKPLPLRGIVRVMDDIEDFEEYIERGVKGGISAGFGNMDKLVKFNYGDFITVTGYPGSGKSNFATSMVMNFAQRDGIKSLFCSFENSPNQLKKKWGQMLIKKPTMDADENVIAELRKQYGFMNEHFYIMQDFTNNLTIDDIISVAEQAIMQNGIKCLIIDPLNKIQFTRTNNITEDIGAVLNKLIAFTKRTKVMTFLVAHPTKPSERGKLGGQSVPSGFDISGSANFLNMSDVVLTVHRKQDECGEKSRAVRVMISKVRDADYGHEGSCYFKYDTYSGEYIETEKQQFENEKVGLNEWGF